MGFFDMFKKPKKPKESANDKALADISRQQFGRYSNKFAPLLGELSDLSKQDRSQTLRGRGNADVMRSLGSPGGPGRTGQVKSAVSAGTRALGSALTGATAADTNRRQAMTEGTMKAAMGVNQSAIQGLGTATNLSTQESIRKLQQDTFKRGLGMDALGTVAGVAGSAAMGMGGAPAMGARDSVFTAASTGNRMRDPRTGFSGVGL